MDASALGWVYNRRCRPHNRYGNADVTWRTDAPRIHTTTRITFALSGPMARFQLGSSSGFERPRFPVLFPRGLTVLGDRLLVHHRRTRVLKLLHCRTDPNLRLVLASAPVGDDASVRDLPVDSLRILLCTWIKWIKQSFLIALRTWHYEPGPPCAKAHRDGARPA